ncbi:phage portal protein [Hoeflea sp.]|uniref:phage portal protein n=1 Tax=Hoeflea sp. TaxID=1940281 RepID=UPI0019C3FC12|nr:phage portal protein [Hoeflea sp.]MBC7282562.1 phage portal protein [Hoeflea sp.]
MGIFDLFRSKPPEQKSTINLDNWRFALWPGTGSGVVVNEATALEVSTVIAIVRRISSDVAKLQIKVVERTANGERRPRPDVPLNRVLSRRPNRWQTSFEFREMMTAHAVLHGDAVAIKQTVRGQVDELIPLVPGQFSIRQEKGWILEYDLMGPRGEVMGTYRQDQVFHLRNMSWNGYRGLNLSRNAREAIGLSAALENNQSTQMRNGAKPQGILTTESNLTEEQIDRVAQGWKAATSKGNAYSTPLLDAGLKFMPVSLNSVDSQLLETRKHQVTEICAAFGMIPAVLGIDDKTQAFASVEAMMQAYVDQVIWPWAERWQQRLDRDCLDADGPLEIMMDMSQMRKASAKDQAEADVKLVTNGLRTPNELRARDGLPPIEGGDTPMRPANMTSGEGTDNEDAPDTDPA